MTRAGKVQLSDLAALQFRVKEAIDDATAHLEGRALVTGQILTITITVPIVENRQEEPIFGAAAGTARYE